jgi:hypothetical protein
MPNKSNHYINVGLLPFSIAAIAADTNTIPAFTYK